mmetsp:Transcript_33000/g.60466  ORF Transcript_33000/g.60466 Transcript_33000/m.60466 type:complete len:244 (-) Transcript_33000:146-877(-)
MGLIELLSQPGLGARVLEGLGPVAFCTLATSSRGLQLNPPSVAWVKCWGSCENPHACAIELLRSQQDNDEELMLDKLFVLTSLCGPASDRNVECLMDVAVQNVQQRAIPLLRQRGFSLELLDVYSLESMVMKDNTAVVKAYLSAGISPDSRANAGRSLLMVATAAQSTAVTRLLLSWQADVNQRSGFGGWTALMWAAHNGWSAGCSMLLAALADVTPQNAAGMGALEIAKQQLHVEVQQLLSM